MKNNQKQYLTKWKLSSKIKPSKETEITPTNGYHSFQDEIRNKEDSPMGQLVTKKHDHGFKNRIYQINKKIKIGIDGIHHHTISKRVYIDTCNQRRRFI